ncbi:MAG TPA: heavy-metal-associated domain-containing protein [Rhodocyclaceae bacterium]|nr:heavy-metal-associated domain-containing protein [Rhodocyclaceae bacterium]
MGTQTLELNVPDISCGGCAGSVTKAIKAQYPDATVTVSVADKHVTVETAATREAITACLAEAGFPVA